MGTNTKGDGDEIEFDIEEMIETDDLDADREIEAFIVLQFMG